VSHALLIIFFIIGFLLIAIEVFITPGLTVFGVLGIIVLGTGIYYAFITLSFAYALGTLFLSLLVVILFLIWFFKSGINRGLALKTRESLSSGFKSYQEEYSQYLNKTGIALTPLRPSGTIRIKNQKMSAMTQGEFIEPNEKVKVIRVEGSKVIVEKVQI
jgi:membrane-bound serine protease (ClpP class)